MRFLTLALLLSASACDSPGNEPTPREIVEALPPGAGGAADSALPSIELSPGAELKDLTIAPRAEGLRPLDRIKIFRFRARAGQTFAAVMHATSGDLNPYLLLTGPEHRTEVELFDQALLPSRPERDVVLVYTAPSAGEYALFVGGENFATSGTFDFSFYDLGVSPPVSLNLTNAAVRALAENLRGKQDKVAGFVKSGLLAEGHDGLLSTGPSFDEVSLAERAEVTRLVSAVNDVRTELFGGFLRANQVEVTDGAVAAVGRAFASLWSLAK